MIGIMALFIASVFTLIAIVLNILDQKDLSRSGSQPLKDVKQHKRIFYYLSVASLVGASLYLWFIILDNQFAYKYVSAYSSTDLSFIYKITAFWAGAEGSFLLWVLLHGLVGLWLYRQKDILPGVKMVHSVVQMCLLIVLMMKSPFTQIAGHAMELTEGGGLNPLLQNPWMVSHPPLLLLGYAALAVPFALAVGSLLGGDYRSWIKKALPFSLLAWAFLGAGIFLGGYWAYETLGWGGYWAWDPVENTSLMPWLVCGGMIHFLLLALRRPSNVKAAGLAAVFAYGLPLLGTLLTRSGAFSDSSTHSFAGEEAGVIIILGIIVFLVLTVPLLLFIAKWRKLPQVGEEEPIKTRGSMTWYGAIALCVFAGIVLLGTLASVVAGFMDSSVVIDMSYYNPTSLLMMMAVLALIVLATFYVWGKNSAMKGIEKAKGTKKGTSKQPDETKEEPEDLELTKKPNRIIAIGVMIVGALLSVGVGWLIGIGPDPGFMNILMFAFVLAGLAGAGAVFATSVLAFFFKKDVGKGMSRAALFTHIGLAILTAGVLFSSAGANKEFLTLGAGEEVSLLGRQVTYIGLDIGDFRLDHDNNLVEPGTGEAVLGFANSTFRGTDTKSVKPTWSPDPGPINLTLGMPHPDSALSEFVLSGFAINEKGVIIGIYKDGVQSILEQLFAVPLEDFVFNNDGNLIEPFTGVLVQGFANSTFQGTQTDVVEPTWSSDPGPINLRLGMPHPDPARSDYALADFTTNENGVVTGVYANGLMEVIEEQLFKVVLKNYTKPGGYVQRFLVDGEIVEVTTAMSEKFGDLHEPVILWSLLEDYYIAPGHIENQESSTDNNHELTKGIPVEIAIGKDTLRVMLKEYVMENQDTDNASVYAVFNVVHNEELQEVRLEWKKTDSGFIPVPVIVFDKYELALTQINKEESKVVLRVQKNYELQKDTPITLAVADEKLTITMKECGINGEEAAANNSYYAVLDVARNGATQENEVQEVRIEANANMTTIPAMAFEQYSFELTGISISQNLIAIEVRDVNESVIDDRVNIEVSTKPLIVLVWLGAILISVGIIWAAIKRWGPSPFQDFRNKK